MKRMRIMRNIWLAAGAMASCSMAIASSSAQADTIAYSVSGTQSNDAATGMSGVEFTPTQNIAVTQLGFTAISLGGGDAPHVTLWNASNGFGNMSLLYDTGDILGSVTSYPAANNGAIQPVSYVSVGTPIQLSAGTTYFVSAPAYWAPSFSSTGSITDSSALGNVSFDYVPGGWNNWPNSGYNLANLGTYSETSDFTTANFQYTVSASTPEPASLGLLAVASLGLLSRRRRQSA